MADKSKTLQLKAQLKAAQRRRDFDAIDRITRELLDTQASCAVSRDLPIDEDHQWSETTIKDTDFKN